MRRFREQWIPAFAGMTERDLIIEFQEKNYPECENRAKRFFAHILKTR
ncbi:Uncharacterized protein dnm_094200 [Desulfonema magnum]|uniref:Uncharacterized protein n=1 Tax=Desulfonema magnum TaxID=45655 RepID=A0A975BXV1_9BACT|nr:Uncharacterized protein dnm_094200 [Desulfonema magnum]